jgi:hypothetical protein
MKAAQCVVRKRTFLHGNAKQREIVGLAVAKNVLQINFGLQQICAIGLAYYLGKILR